MIKVKDSERFTRLIEALEQDVVDAHIHFRLYNDLRAVLYEHPRVIVESRTFWSLTLEAHLQTSVQKLCRAFDPNDNSLHLYSWLLTIKHNLHLFDEDQFRARLTGNPFVESLTIHPRQPDEAVLEQDIASCSADDRLVKALVIYRGSQIAHRNARNVVAQKEFGDKHPLTFEGLSNSWLDR